MVPLEWPVNSNLFPLGSRRANPQVIGEKFFTFVNSKVYFKNLSSPSSFNIEIILFGNNKKISSDSIFFSYNGTIANNRVSNCIENNNPLFFKLCMQMKLLLFIDMLIKNSFLHKKLSNSIFIRWGFWKIIKGSIFIKSHTWMLVKFLLLSADAIKSLEERAIAVTIFLWCK